MLEKIGLPPKPSMRGGNWVVDASHCQGCSRQFTFINRKHHCRRCGGLFCNGCTQQRMVLRGQGDSAVRICDPCKQIEEATRFELRHRNRGIKSNIKPTANEDALLKELLDGDKPASKSARKFRHDKIPDIRRDTSSSSSSSIQDLSGFSESVENNIRSMSTGEKIAEVNEMCSTNPEELHRLAMEEKSNHKLLKAEGKSGEALAAFKHGKELENQAAALKIASSSASSTIQDPCVSSESVDTTVTRSKSPGVENNMLVEVSSSSPEEIRRLAVEEKIKYKLLKAEGKSGEALAAYKRGKELEKQAAALEMTMKKKLRLTSVQKYAEDHDGIIDRKKVSVNMNKAGKDDLMNELRELGWSDADLHDADKKQEPLSLEGELRSILRETPQTSHSGHVSSGVDRSHVVSLKKKALMLKREGKLAEAKEELKQAKILEKQLEEQELLAGAEDSDDELSALIRDMDADKQDNLLSNISEPGINFDALTNLEDDFALGGGGFDVTDDDMNDPEITAALKSFGWTEEDDNPTETFLQSSNKKVSAEILSLKKEAVNQKRAGNMADARELLRKAKLLEKDLVVSEGIVQDDEPSLELDPSKSQFSEKATTPTRHSENIAPTDLSDNQQPRKSKLAIQKELLALKRKALTLRREGRAEEAEEELRKGKSLEQQLEEMEKPQKFVVSKGSPDDNIKESRSSKPDSPKSGLVEEADDAEVTEQDMQDPALLSLLENLGWKDDLESSKKSKLTAEPSDKGPVTLKLPSKPTKSKGQLQRELLGIKRKALTLRRQGKTEEAEEELRRAKGLEDQLAELDSGHQLDSRAKNGADSSLSSFPTKKSGTPIMSQDEPDFASLISSSSGMIANQIKNIDGPTPALNQEENRVLIQKECHNIERESSRGQGKTDKSNEELNKLKDLKNLHAKMEVEQPFYVAESSSYRLNLSIADKEPENLTAGFNEFQKNEGIRNEISDSSLSNVFYSDKLSTTSSAAEDLSVSEQNVDETVSIKPLSSQHVKMSDLLTGDEKNATPLPSKEQDQIPDKNNPILSDSSLQLDRQPITVQTGVSCDENPNNLLDYDSRVMEGTAAVPSLDEELNVAKELHSTMDQILERKRKAVALKKEGKMTEALAELRQAKLLEKSLGESSHKENVATRTEPVSLVDRTSKEKSKKASSPSPKPMSSRERFKLQQESLSHKRQARKLRGEGKLEESEALFELAKKLEAQIQEADSTDTNVSLNKEDESLVEDFLDPQLMSALKAIGWNEKDISSHAPVPKVEAEPEDINKSSRKSSPAQQVLPNHAVLSEGQARKNNNTNIITEKFHLEEQIKSEKLRALNLKRSGRQSDALEALRSAKRLEKKLESLSS